MKLLHVSPFYEPAPGHGGMARAAGGLCRALARRGHDVVVATALLQPEDPLDERRGGVRVRRFSGPAFLRRRLVPWAPGLGRLLAPALEAVDVVHLHGHRNGLAAAAARAASRRGVPYVWQPHGTFPHHGQHAWAKAAFDRIVGDRVVVGAAAALAVSDAEARDLGGEPQVIPNGVEGLAPPHPQRPLKRPGAPLLFVGTDRPQKRGTLLPGLLGALPQARLRLAGPYGRRFMRSFAAFGDRVSWDGVLGDAALAAAYGDASLVVHPAVGEAFGLVPFEAAFHGTAAVVAGGHGCGEWFRGAGGCVVPPDDPVALVDAVRRRLEVPGIADAESRAVAAFAISALTWERAAEAVERLYLAVLDRRGRRPGAA